MKDFGHLSYFLGLEITYSIDGLYITQAKYAFELFSWARLTGSKTIDTLVELNAYLTPLAGKPLSNPSLYKRLVSSLVYLTVTRRDISYVVHQMCKFLCNIPVRKKEKKKSKSQISFNGSHVPPT